MKIILLVSLYWCRLNNYASVSIKTHRIISDRNAIEPLERFVFAFLLHDILVAISNRSCDRSRRLAHADDV